MRSYSFIIPGDAPLWAQQIQVQLNGVLARIAVDMRPRYAKKADLPTDGSIRTAIVTDEAGGEVLAFLDSLGQWRRTTDRAVVS